MGFFYSNKLLIKSYQRGIYVLSVALAVEINPSINVGSPLQSERLRQTFKQMTHPHVPLLILWGKILEK